MNPAVYEHLTIAQRYELGRSDGFAEGADDERWHPENVPNRLAELRDDVARARRGRQAREYFRETYPVLHDAARTWQAYTVGEARGYREMARWPSSHQTKRSYE